jgi:HAD superfamily hydrolase (TIGR01509 family)
MSTVRTVRTVRAVALDVDGTLVDSEPLHLRALQAACRAHDVDISDHGPSPFVGVSIADVWRVLAPRFERTLGHLDDNGERQFRATVTEHYLAHADEVQALPGARQAIEHLAQQGVALAAVSNSERAIVEANLRAVGAQAHFGAVVSLDDVRNPKPAPEPYLQALMHLGASAHDAWAVEDSPSGARSARAAGLRVLVVGADPEARGDHRLGGLHEFVPWWEATQAQLDQQHQEARLGSTGLAEAGANR